MSDDLSNLRLTPAELDDRSGALTNDLALPVAFLALDLTTPSGQQLHYVLDVLHTRSFILGRSSEILIADPMVSQRHALVCFDPSRGWELLDLNSTNGTALNGTRIQSLSTLSAGDVIEVGQSTLRVTRLVAAASPMGAGRAEGEPPATVHRLAISDQPAALPQAPTAPSSQFKEQLEQIRIEIDEVRKEREVREILESDFFREVRQKAGDIRRGSDTPSVGQTQQ